MITNGVSACKLALGLNALRYLIKTSDGEEHGVDSDDHLLNYIKQLVYKNDNESCDKVQEWIENNVDNSTIFTSKKYGFKIAEVKYLKNKYSLGLKSKDKIIKRMLEKL